ncbi:hypothetical protein M432DRAFT_298186 [Thermoascus aurantiacus ATCC 26904]
MYSCANYSRGCRGRVNVPGGKCADCVSLHVFLNLYDSRSSAFCRVVYASSLPIAHIWWLSVTQSDGVSISILVVALGPPSRSNSPAYCRSLISGNLSLPSFTLARKAGLFTPVGNKALGMILWVHSSAAGEQRASTELGYHRWLS